ncbi:MAG TPA: Crp/Fnr family transcriptional regulator [Chitinophagaceae bacterium]|jgi:CRP-like cAMP-binding protein|nr:Crp/Fnr family transcriptional regulator [Chitinophagaceae bacterium]
MTELLFQKFDEKIELTEEEKKLSQSFFIQKKLRRKQYLLQEGDVCKYIAFVEKGLLRSYTVDDKGNEHITQFAFEGWWISDQYSYLTGEPSEYNIEVMDDCALLLLTKQKEEEMLEKIPKFERYFRILLQNNLIATQKRLVSSLTQTAEERYNEFISACPTTLPHRIPQHMLASYLGVTPETISRIRKQMSLKNNEGARDKVQEH